MASGDVFGPSLSPWELEQAILTLFSTPPAGSTYPLIVYYVADQERVNGLEPQTLPVPPGPNSYQGGADAGTMMAEWFPMLTVNVTPIGQASKIDPATYQQTWQVTVYASAGDDSENTARRNSGLLATAAALLIAQNGSLGIGATGTTVTSMPDPRMLDAVGARQVYQTPFKFQTLTVGCLTVGGPISFLPDPYTAPDGWPVAQTVTTTVTATAD